MIRIILIVTIAVTSFKSFSQADTTKLGAYEVNINGQWISPESGTPPINLNDLVNFDDVLSSNIKYPNLARRMGIEGTTLISIQIDKDGNTKNKSVILDIGADTKKELNTVLQLLPTKWIPATYNNMPVESSVNILVKYSLANSNSVENSAAFYKCFIASAFSGKTKNVVTIRTKHKKRKMTPTRLWMKVTPIAGVML